MFVLNGFTHFLTRCVVHTDMLVMCSSEALVCAPMDQLNKNKINIHNVSYCNSHLYLGPLPLDGSDNLDAFFPP